MGDRGNQANPMVAFRDLMRAESSKISQANDQVILGVICAVKDGIDLEVQIDGFGSGPIDALWCVPGSQPALGMRVVMNGLTGGQKWFVIAVASATTGASGQKSYFLAAGADTFVKADHPGLRAVFIIVVGGGAGGGGCATGTSSSQAAAGGGGGGGGYAEAYVLAKNLADSEEVIVAAGGAGGVAGVNNGAAGGTSSFENSGASGFFARALGGSQGLGGPLRAGESYGANGGFGGNGDIGDHTSVGGNGEAVWAGFARVRPASGGGSRFSGQNQGRISTTSGRNGADGKNFGQGGEGGCNANDQGVGRSGGDGSVGAVIVETIF